MPDTEDTGDTVISANCYTCFGLYLHPSSGAHITVPTVHIQSRSPQLEVTVSKMPYTEDTVDTVI